MAWSRSCQNEQLVRLRPYSFSWLLLLTRRYNNDAEIKAQKIGAPTMTFGAKNENQKPE